MPKKIKTNADVIIASLQDQPIEYENCITSWIECPSAYLKKDPCEKMDYDEIRSSDVCHCCKLEWLNATFKEF